jgi:hypothetical protein
MLGPDLSLDASNNSKFPVKRNQSLLNTSRKSQQKDVDESAGAEEEGAAEGGASGESIDEDGSDGDDDNRR